MEPLDFEKRFELLMNRMWTLQIRVGELIEFEKQWSELFEQLEKKTGKECTIRINNNEVFRSFRWDRYQVLISDLVSLLKNEVDFKNPNSLLKQLNKHFYLQPLEAYIEHEYNPHFIFGKDLEDTSEERARRKKQAQLEQATRMYNSRVNILRKLFPKINTETYAITDNDIKALLERIELLRKSIVDQRVFFNHKYEESATNRVAESVNDINVQEFYNISNELFELFNDIGLLYRNLTYSKIDSDSEKHISDQIDLILFGSIDNCIHTFYKDQPNKEILYSDARNSYFRSEKIIKLTHDEDT